MLHTSFNSENGLKLNILSLECEVDYVNSTSLYLHVTHSDYYDSFRKNGFSLTEKKRAREEIDEQESEDPSESSMNMDEDCHNLLLWQYRNRAQVLVDQYPIKYGAKPGPYLFIVVSIPGGIGKKSARDDTHLVEEVHEKSIQIVAYARFEQVEQVEEPQP